jgi:hypothetical protein
MLELELDEILLLREMIIARIAQLELNEPPLNHITLALQLAMARRILGVIDAYINRPLDEA